MKVEIKNKQQLRKIIELLVRFDEKTERHMRYENPELHYMRKVIIAANQDNVTYNVKPLNEHLDGASAYLLEVSYVMKTGDCEHALHTSWIHEDGIFMERQTAPEGHPVHSIVCLTDLYNESK